MPRRGRPGAIDELIAQSKTPSGYKHYNVPASKITDEQLQKMINTANNRLWHLEHAGFDDESQGYNTLRRYASDKDLSDSRYYKYNELADTVRIRKDLEFATTMERSDFVNKVRDILNYSTGTVGGTKKAIEKAFEAYEPLMKAKKLVDPKLYRQKFDEYRELWKIYRQTNKDSHEKAKSEAVFNAMLNEDFNGMTQSQAQHAMKIYNNYNVNEADKRLKQYQKYLDKERKKKKGAI